MSPPPTPRRGVGPLGIVSLAGWLFADLVLVLAVVTMADRPDPLAVTAAPSSSPSPTASPTPTGPRSLVKKAVKFEVRGGDSGAIVDQLTERTETWSGREAALVMTFGGGSAGNSYARRVNSLLGKARPSMFTAQTATEDFHDLNRSANTATLTVYFYTSRN
ncbi:hypothetical protein [Actinomadura sp. 3N508]|uniref:hypothetical protein n=1 Tax=Actinomadura sp. 3N508 TaxID=3375153 RepID=UPI0037AA33EC